MSPQTGNAAGAYPVNALDWPGLRALWVEIQAGRAAGWHAGKAFEHLVLRAFQLSGAEVTTPYSVKIDNEVVEQIDGAVRLEGLWCIVEAKDTRDPTTIGTIAKLRNQLSRRPAGTLGLLFSRCGYTSPAVLLAQYMAPQTILLWTGEEVGFLLDREDFAQGLIEKFKHCVERAVPDHDVRVSLR